MHVQRRQLSHTLILIVTCLVLCAACDDSEMTFTEAVSAVYTPCDKADTKLRAAEKGMQLVFEPCGSNNFFHFAWNPKGTSLYYQTNQGPWVFKDTGENYPLRIGKPRSNAAWLDDDTIAFPDESGRQIGVYEVGTHVLRLLEIVPVEPQELVRGREQGQIFFLAADVPGGVQDIYSMQVQTGKVERAFEWLRGGVETFTYQSPADLLCYREIGVADVACVRGADGTAVHTARNRTRGTVSVDGRYLVTEGEGEAVQTFPDAAAKGTKIPDYLPTEIRPPALWIRDLKTGEEFSWKGVHGTQFGWYEPTPYFASFVIWGTDNQAANQNISLVDLRPVLKEQGWTPPTDREGKPVDPAAASEVSEPGPRSPGKGATRTGRLQN
ncbi:MAG TPA: hypothetical protein DIU15_10755 [Deltaproteobacteria bacterium]|nr:hypothetical protein [Deltaproteobacteria bacterium]HCP46516.1 hypothetical protein [Deltaproteobacteria bacterium]